jgi:hypothetical protein
MSDGILAREVQAPALVYVRGVGGKVEGQVWHERIDDLENYWRGRILTWHRLDGETAGIPLDQLKQLFPAPAERPASPKVKL